MTDPTRERDDMARAVLELAERFDLLKDSRCDACARGPGTHAAAAAVIAGRPIPAWEHAGDCPIGKAEKVLRR
jgi:hypothetical protein